MHTAGEFSMSVVNEQTLKSKILIVDDNPTNVLLLEHMLALAGYVHVKSTTDPREVESLHEAERFDLILLDIRMPYLDGFEVMEALSTRIKDDYLPVLVLTAQRDKETKLKALELGARDFIIKPFDSTEVLNRISNMLEVRGLYSEKKNRANILEKKVLERTFELDKRNRELENTRHEIVQSLGRAGEYRDNETGYHVIRMSKSCEVLALASGLSRDKAELILHASPMHDVGKIGIPDHILLKPGALDADEWAIMKTHVDIGVRILGTQDSDLMNLARSIAQTHHEKWDGSGYPNALRGSLIPVEGRISAICDVFDALTSERPYKQAWPVAKALEFVKEQSGSHFDPQLVNLLNTSLPQILKIRETYADVDQATMQSCSRV
jgi:cyclic di-GMP phosphodiesterase